MVDVYRGKEGIDPSVVRTRNYDMVIAPVHLDPGHPLLRELTFPVITHHQAVRWILGRSTPARFIEVTGARGKTTTAHALAHLMQGPGILHTSCGTVLMPEKENVGTNGITPASLLAAAESAHSSDRWLIAEVSLGFVGAGELGILTSLDTYTFAAGKRDALSEKLRSGAGLPWLVVPPGSHRSGNRLPADHVARATGSTCRYAWNGFSGTYENPLLSIEAYREPLLIVTAAACVLGIDPPHFPVFAPIRGRKAISRFGETLVVDDSNSGTCARTARDAICLARAHAKMDAPLVLVIGKESGAICEGFPEEEIASVVREESLDRIVLVGDYDPAIACPGKGDGCIARAHTLDEGRKIAMELSEGGIVVLAVKTWR